MKKVFIRIKNETLPAYQVDKTQYELQSWGVRIVYQGKVIMIPWGQIIDITEE